MQNKEIFENYIEKFSQTAERDIETLQWAGVKWGIISKLVDFKDKKVLDVGCSVGYICSQIAANGAKAVTGVDVRKDIIQSASGARMELGIGTTNLAFLPQDWRTYEPQTTEENEFDIVLCTGLLHYFHREDYGEVFAKLAYVCNDILVLEMKVKNDTDDKPRISETSKSGTTVPTLKWLKRTVLRCGFRVIWRKTGNDWPSGGKGRELWVLQKLPEVPYRDSWPKGFSPGDTVPLPIDHPILNYYYKTVDRGTADWWIWVGQVARNFKPWLFLPLVYQPSRKGMSDGGHRLMVAKRLGHKVIKVRMM